MSRLALIAGVCGVLLMGCSTSDGNPQPSGSRDVGPSSTGGIGASPTVTLPDTGPLGEPIALRYDGTYSVGYRRWSEYGQEYLGSGCSPSSTTSLEDGAWFGYLTRWGAESSDFDLACVNYDDEVTNNNTSIRTLPMSEDALYVFNWGEFPGYSGRYPFGYSFANVVEAKATIGLPQTSDAVWVYVDGGVVTQVEAWVVDTDHDLLRAGLPWVPYGPESEPDTNHPYHADVMPPGSYGDGDNYWEYGFPWEEVDQEAGLGPGCGPDTPDSLPDGYYYGHVWKWGVSEVGFHPEWMWPGDSPRPCDTIPYGETGSWFVPLADDAQFLSQQSPIGALSARTVIGLPDSIRPPAWMDSVYVYINDGEITQIHGEWSP